MAIIDFGDPDRAAEAAAEIILPALGPHQAPITVVRERLARVQSLIHKILVERTVKAVGARFGGVVEDATGGLSELWRKAVGLQRKLLQRFYRRLFFIGNPGMQAAS